MNAIRLRRKIESETLHLPELRQFIGKTVEFIVLEEDEKQECPSAADLQKILHGSIVRDDDPFEPVAADDWEAVQ